MTKQSVAIRVICIDPPAPPPGFEAGQFGLQDKNKQILEGEEISANERQYEFELDVKNHSDGTPNFTGTFAHGNQAERFLYLSQMGIQGSSWQIIKRIKIPLKTITWEQVETILNDDTSVLEVLVSGQGAATVPLLGEGWIIQNRERGDSTG